VEVDAYKIDHEQLSEFLNSNTIIELKVRGLSQTLTLNDSLYQSIRCLHIVSEALIDLSKLKSLKILGVYPKEDEISKVIPYLASKFTPNLFKRMQINLEVGRYSPMI
jgi:hypothetical protein